MKNMLDLVLLKKKSKKFKITLLLSYFLFATFLLIAIFLLHVKYSQDEAIEHFKQDIEQEGRFKERFLKNFYQKNDNVVKALSDNKIFLDFVKNGKSNFKHVDSLFEALMLSNDNYMQLRYIDKNGIEIIRFDRKEIAQEPIQVSRTKLQDKSKRYYYKACKNIKNNEIWYSDIDLNIEYGKIETPIKPVLRVAHQVTLNNSFEGMIIINIFMKPSLKSLVESSTFDIYLTDTDGNFLIHKNKEKNWTKYLNKGINVSNDLEIDLLHVKNNNGYFDKKNKYYIHPLINSRYSNYRLIFLPNKDKIEKTEETIKQRVIITVLFAILIAVPFSFIVGFPAKKLYQELIKQSANLTQLTNNLEKKVALEIEKNRKKDKVLENQSKLAALGEMIGNIAHQWRHPITRVSLMMQNIRTFKEHGKLSDELLNKYISISLEQLDYMSQTIDDFKDFYKPDVKKKKFNIYDAINNATNIISASIKHSGVDIKIGGKENTFTKGYKNQFAQVILNILQNAKDALDENNVKDPYIKIAINEDGNTINISIEDNAGGIKLNNINNIFDPYITTKQKNGTGIGLYMSKMIVEENFQGNIYATNGINGAIFTIELPKT